MDTDGTRLPYDRSSAATVRVLAAADHLELGAFVCRSPVRGCAILRAFRVRALGAGRSWREAPRTGGVPRRIATRL